MKCEETGLMEFKRFEQTLIYFLLDDNEEVVYVGQTRIGLARPFQHIEKEYTTIRLMPCDEGELDALEDKYIKKYLPKYNKELNRPMNMSLRKATLSVRELIPTFNLRKLKKVLALLEIKPFEFNGVLYITKENFERVEEYLYVEAD